MPETLATFRGTVRCEYSVQARTLTLSGTDAASPGEATALTFSAAAPTDCSGTLEDALVEHVEGAHYRIRSGTREWPIQAGAAHVHRDIAAAFYRAIPPRPAPWRKRLFWAVVLALAASRPGLAALRLLRRKV
jgi:hypothetical protein